MDLRIFISLFGFICLHGMTGGLSRCPVGYFHCDNGKCVASSWKCDGIDDCGDNTDEHALLCQTGSTDCVGKFQCKNRETCIPQHDVCDSREDCSDGSDELNCDSVKCESFQFPCDDKKNCIPQHFHCDGYLDCQDGSDEKDCIAASVDCTVNNQKYLCQDGKTCIDLAKVCNSNPDCPDKSDEAADCDKICHSSECSHTCIPTPTGAVCTCEKGYEINIRDNKTCTDKDECEKMPEHPCSQNCVNTPGSFFCTCHTDYQLQENGRQCKVSNTGSEPILIYAKKSEIRKLYMTSGESNTLVGDLDDVLDIAYESTNNVLYWIDGIENKVYYTKIGEHGESKLPGVTVGLKSPDKLSVDWISKKIYIADSGRREIIACTMFSVNCAVVLKELANVKDVVVYPQKRMMFWSEWSTPSRISISAMDGQNPSIFLEFQSGHPTCLLLDYATDMLYWVDSLYGIIERINLDGTKRKIILSHQVHNPNSIVVFEDNIIWSERNKHSAVSMANKFSGKSMKTLIKDANGARAITIAHPAIQSKEDDPCTSTLCSDVCLLSNNTAGFTCACPLNKVLADDKLTCTDLKGVPTLFAAVNAEIIKFPLSYIGNTPNERVIVNGLIAIEAMSIDPVGEALYFFDAGTKMISTVKFSSFGTQNPSVIIRDDLWGVDSIAVDWIGRSIYWTDSIKRTVEVSSMDGEVRIVVLSQYMKKPKSIALAPSSGYMYISAVGESFMIEKCHMDGTNCLMLIEEEGSPISLTLDEKAERLYWIEMKYGQIVSLSVMGKDRKSILSVSGAYRDVIIRGIDHPLSLAQYRNMLFWTDAETSIFVANMSDVSSSRNTFISDIPGNAALCVLQETYNVTNACSERNGGCSHMCIAKPMGERVCNCPSKQVLSQNLKTCIGSAVTVPVSCSAGMFSCRDDPSNCIESYLKCDGNPNCMDRSDEENCSVSEMSCPHHEFECENGACIHEKWICDTDDDCGDGSDERNCKAVEKSCSSSEFKCDQNECISKFQVCDEILDCFDGTDEENCSMCDAQDFTCRDGQCIHGPWRCDGVAECYDESDEKDCEICKSGFVCDNGECVSNQLVCNAEQDCSDGSDEKLCITTLASAKFKEVDECQFAAPVCSQECQNTKDGYICSCVQGYRLENFKNCKALDPSSSYFIVSTKNNLRYYDLNGDMLKTVPSQQRGRITSLDVHFETKNIYWTSDQSKIICYSAQLQKIITIKNINGTAEGIAVDWVGRNIYYTDRSTKQISVCAITNSLKYCIILVSTRLLSPRSIIVYPQKGIMFWSDIGHGAKIESSWMNGENRKIIIGENTFWPNGLAIDYGADMLYWVDAHHDVVEGSRLDGTKRFELAKLKHPFSISVFEDSIFIGNWDSSSVEKINKLQTSNITTFPNIDRPMGLKVVHHLLQQSVPDEENPCNSMMCEQICLLHPEGATCRCSHGFLKDELAPNKCKGLITKCSKHCNNGTCVLIAMLEMEICRCDPGYTGSFCEMNINQLTGASMLSATEVQSNTEFTLSTQALPSTQNASKGANKNTWVIGLIIGIVLLNILCFSIIIYIKKFRKKPDLVGLIRYCQQDNVPNEEVVDLVNDNMAFGNPNFQDYEDLNRNIVKNKNHMKYNQLNNDTLSLDSAFSSHYGNGNTTINNDLSQSTDP